MSLLRHTVEDRGFTTPCHIYAGGKNQKGYGLVTIREPGKPRRTQAAHCRSYELECGPIPEGKELDHLCEQRACIRVDHLEPVTRTANVRRSRATKLTEEAVAAIRASEASGAELGRRFGVSRTQISDIRRGKVWAAA